MIMARLSTSREATFSSFTKLGMNFGIPGSAPSPSTPRGRDVGQLVPERRAQLGRFAYYPHGAWVRPAPPAQPPQAESFRLLERRHPHPLDGEGGSREPMDVTSRARPSHFQNFQQKCWRRFCPEAKPCVQSAPCPCAPSMTITPAEWHQLNARCASSLGNFNEEAGRTCRRLAGI
jgi:hypothetical protein